MSAPLRDKPRPVVGAEKRDEIEITPGMIEAGSAEYLGFDQERDSVKAMVERVYRAMAAVAGEDS